MDPLVHLMQGNGVDDLGGGNLDFESGCWSGDLFDHFCLFERLKSECGGFVETLGLNLRRMTQTLQVSEMNEARSDRHSEAILAPSSSYRPPRAEGLGLIAW